MIEHRQDYSITLMCRALRVARAGYYLWLHTPASDRAIEDRRLLQLIHQSYKASHCIYGARRVLGDLCEIGKTCGKHRIERIMKANKIKAVRGYKRPQYQSGRPSIIAPNRVQREFSVDQPNKVWVTDITYVRTWQ